MQRVTEPEKGTDATKERMKSYSDKLAGKFKEKRLLVDSSTEPDLEEWWDLLEDDWDFADEFNRLFDNTDVPEADDNFDPDTYNDYINKEISVDQGDVHPVRATVTKR